MIRYFCDICERELPLNERGRLVREYGRLKAEVIVSVDKTWNSGHACHECIAKAVTLGKPA